MAGEFPVGPVVLGYLLLRGPSHGYELLSHLHADLGRVWRVAPSQLYATLDLLARRGLILGAKEPQENRPSRIRYTLTQKGQETFWKWVVSPVPRVRLLHPQLLPKIFFLLKLSPDQIPKLLAVQKETLLALRSRVGEEKPTDPFHRVLRGLRLRQLEAGLAWIEEVLEKEVCV